MVETTRWAGRMAVSTALALGLSLSVGGIAPAAAHGAQAKKPPAPGLPPIAVLDVMSVGRHPLGVAIDPDPGRAVIADRGSKNISVLDLSSRAAVATIAVGRQPTGVAVNPLTKVAVVSLAAEHAVALVSLNSFEVLRKVGVGRRPAGVAVDPGLDIALVANRNSGSVSLLDLTTHNVIADIAVGRAPSAVAINPVTHVAAVTNTGDGSVTLLGLDDRENPILIGVIPLPHSRHHADARRHGHSGHHHSRQHGSKPWHDHDHDGRHDDRHDSRHDGRRARPTGVAFDFGADVNRLVIADPGNDALHIVTLHMATSEPLAIHSVAVGRKPMAVAVNPGGDFALVTSDRDEVFGVQLSTRAVVGGAQVGKHPRGVAIDPGACRAVVTNHKGRTVSLVAASCAPRLTALSPPAVLAGTPVTLTMKGMGFRADSTVNVGAQGGLAPSTVAPETLSLALMAPATPGPVSVSVTSAGQTSNSLALQVVATLPPVLTRVSPGASAATGEALTLVLDGERFAAGARVIYAGQPLPPATMTGCAAPRCVAATIPAHDPAGSPLARLGLTLRGGVSQVMVENPDGARTEPRPLVLTNPTPVLSALVPNTATQGTDDKIITIIGDGFVADLSSGTPVAISQVLFNGVPVPAVPYGPNPRVQLTATVPASILQVPGVYSVTVVNPTVGVPPLGGGESFAQPFTVTPLNPNVTIRTVSTGGSPGVVAAWREGTSLLAAAGLSHEGAVVLLDVTDPTNPGILSGPVTLTAPSYNTVGDLAINTVTRRLVTTLPSPGQVAVVDVTNPLVPTWTAVDLTPDSFPFAVAVDETRNRAVVASQGDLTVTVIDLARAQPAVLATFPLPASAESPVAVAVDPVTNVAVVLDQRDSELTGNSAVFLVDLVSGAIEEIEVQLGASGVAVNSATNRAVVTNQESNTASIIDLVLRRRTADVPVGNQPSGVAIDPATNKALVANIQNNEITAINLTTLATEAIFMGVLGAELPVDIQWLPNAVRGVAVCGTLIGGNVVVLGIPPGILP